jgi:hypothetical protein
VTKGAPFAGFKSNKVRTGTEMFSDTELSVLKSVIGFFADIMIGTVRGLTPFFF